jgi:protein-disulfide isomerase
VEVAVDPARLRGEPNAPVTIVEFADFQCPYCRTVETVLAQLRDKYQSKVRFAFRDFPLRAIHPQAQAAAEASRCAGEQGKFWEYHDLLFANQSRLNADTYRDLAGSAGLDGERFAACLASGKYRAQIENDLAAGAASGVSGTPAFIINGTVLTGSQPLSAFEKIIDSQLLTTMASRMPAGDR